MKNNTHFLKFNRFFYGILISLSFANKPLLATLINLPPIIEQHHPVNGISAFEGWKQLLSPENAKEIAYIGTFKIHDNIKNASYIMDMIRKFADYKTPQCRYKVFSESRLKDVEKRSFPTLDSVSKEVSLATAAKTFLCANISSFKNCHFKIILTENCQ